ncbi:MAG TPA: AfsA-related hotdog domain-containing protein [Pseudonocardiaceae bacterium]|nr:AfsA-related hotdog domain-containing protein [Pseudonocardiaceae bacterium]
METQDVGAVTAAESAVDVDETHVIVVADRFRGFVDDGRVWTVSGLLGRIESGAFDDITGAVRLHAGQGIGPFEHEHVQAALDRRGVSDRVRLVADDAEPAGRDQVHKHRAENVLLAGLRRTGTQSFAADLRVHGDNELLLDHQTGEHVQGMVIVEAARQMFLGVFETGYRHRWPLRGYYVVWNSVRLSFDGFLFPLPAQLSCVVHELSLDDPQRLVFEVAVELRQSGKVVASGEIGFTGFDTGLISSVEHRQAVKAVRHELAAVAAR